MAWDYSPTTAQVKVMSCMGHGVVIVAADRTEREQDCARNELHPSAQFELSFKF